MTAPASEAGADSLLLDTHVWWWLMEGEAARLSRGVRTRIERAATHGVLAVSTMSVWELGMLEAKGRLRLAVDVRDWVRRSLGLPGLTTVPLTPSIALESTRLPGAPHGDPADRILTATARLRRMTLVTADRALLAYGQAGYLRTVDAGRA